MLAFVPQAWIISVLCFILGILLVIRVYKENNPLLWGKVGTLLIIACVYFLIDFQYFNIVEARVLSRWSWIMYLVSELSYHFSQRIGNWIGTRH